MVVRLAPIEMGSVGAPQLAPHVRHRRSGGDGLHLLLAGGLQVLAPLGLGPQGALAALAPLGDPFEVQVGAARRLQALLRANRAPPPDPISPERRRRLCRLLRALDARADGASYRQVAEHILGARFTDSLAWRTSPARDTAIRLCRSGLTYVRGGYLGLLRF